ncbi:MAG TPA: hypothetical protein VK048_05895 [Atopostipes sp.]|nr:hypothetical protein [Atopostipes sp.]
MNKELLKKVKLGVISLSVLGVLVACGDTAEEPIDDPGVEAPGTPGGEPAEDPQVEPGDEEDENAVDDGAEDDEDLGTGGDTDEETDN